MATSTTPQPDTAERPENSTTSVDANRPKPEADNRAAVRPSDGLALLFSGFSQIASVLRDLDVWVRQRSRSLAWAQWRSGRQRSRALRQHGISMLLAATTAAAARTHGPWRLSRHPVLQGALPMTFFAAYGLSNLAPATA